jgi:hypothetical protein
VQFRGGYRYPDLAVPLTLVALLLGAAVLLGAWYFGRPRPLLQSAGLVCGLLGTAFLGAAFTPVGLVPPQGGFRSRVCWFFEQQDGVTVQFTQWAFYLGLLLLAAAVVVGALS